MRKNRRRLNRDSFLDRCRDFRDEILGEVVWNIILFIPRMLFRLVKSIFNHY